MERKSGYYWVNLKGEWVIDKYFDSWWYLVGYGRNLRDTNFEEIDETPIVKNKTV